jgi:hypothetical protein
MKKKIGTLILLSSPLIFLIYFFIESYIYDLPPLAFNLILLYIAAGLFFIIPKEK